MIMKSRLIFKALSACINFLIMFGIAIIVPRVLGPIEYGKIGYINASMRFVLQFSSMTSITSYIYFISNKKYPIPQVNTVYLSFFSIIVIITTLLVSLSIYSTTLKSIFWANISNTSYIYLGLILSIFLFLQQCLMAFADCGKHTITSEILKLTFTVLFLALLIIAGVYQWLNIKWYYTLFIISLIAYFIVFLYKLPFSFSGISFNKLKSIVLDMFKYLKPLITFSLIATFYSFAGRFVLQKTAGLEQQGFYTFAFSVAMVFVTILTSIMTIYMSKITELFSENKIDQARQLFLSIVYKIYPLHAFIALFCIVFANQIISFLMGPEYIGAAKALQWLSLFSLLHTFGLLSGNLFFGSNRTKTYAKINSAFMCLGLLLIASFLLAENLILDAATLSAIMAIIYGLRVLLQMHLNIRFLVIDLQPFLLKLLSLTIFILSPVIIISFISSNLIISASLTVITLLTLNFIFKDYLDLINIIIKPAKSYLKL